MKKLTLFMHTSLDGFVAGTNGEMDWINIADEIFESASEATDRADTALYGRKTFEMMDNYWPTAASQPGATKHDIEHSTWYNKVPKVVLSRTMKNGSIPNVKVISKDLSTEINKLKQGSGKNIVIFGSPGASHALMQENLIDDYFLFVNPIVLGNGIPLFDGIKNHLKLKLVTTKVLDSAVVMLHYQKVADN